MKKLIKKWLLSGFLCSLCTGANSESIKVFASLHDGHGFWMAHKGFTEAVNKSIGMDLDWYWGNNDHFAYPKEVIQASKGSKPYDAVLIVNFLKVSRKILPKIEGSKTILFNNVNPIPAEKMGNPREKYKNFVGEVFIDEEEAGEKLALLLIEEALKKGLVDGAGTVNVFAIGGHHADALQQARDRGLKRAIKKMGKKAKLLQVANAKNWSTKEGEFLFSKGLKRFKETNVVWSANDDIAVGVIAAIKKSGKTPGKDILTGGMDWTPDALAAVESGEMVCSLGGLFMHGGWASILAYDYLGKKDFKSDVGVRVKTDIEVLSSENIADYLKKFKTRDWSKVDFKKFSKRHNPKLKKYDFSVKALLENLK